MLPCLFKTLFAELLHHSLGKRHITQGEPNQCTPLRRCAHQRQCYSLNLVKPGEHHMISSSSSSSASSAESATRISKGAPKAGHIIGLISFAHKKYKTGARGAARSSQKVRDVRTGRPQPRCIMPDRSMCSRSWHPAQKAQSESAKEHQKQATFMIIGVICFAHKKYKAGALGAARS